MRRSRRANEASLFMPRALWKFWPLSRLFAGWCTTRDQRIPTDHSASRRPEACLPQSHWSYWRPTKGLSSNWKKLWFAQRCAVLCRSTDLSHGYGCVQRHPPRHMNRLQLWPPSKEKVATRIQTDRGTRWRVACNPRLTLVVFVRFLLGKFESYHKEQTILHADLEKTYLWIL